MRESMPGVSAEAAIGGLSTRLRGRVRPELGLARFHPAAQGHEVHAAAPALREHLGVLLDDVVGDVLAENLDLGVVVIVGGIAELDLGDQVLGRCVLDVGLVEQGGLDPRLARRRIEDLFLDRRVRLEHVADRRPPACAAGRRSAFFFASFSYCLNSAETCR